MQDAGTDSPPTGAAPTPFSAFRGDQMVVGQPYLALVTERLRDWETDPHVIDEDGELGLVLVGLLPVPAIQWLERHQPGWLAEARAGVAEDRLPVSALDLVVRCLRRSFREQFRGWVPTIGKNRVVSHVTRSFTYDDQMQGAYANDWGTPVRPAYANDWGTPVRPAYANDWGTPVRSSYANDWGGQGGPRPVPTSQREGQLENRAERPGEGVRVGIIDSYLVEHAWLRGGYVAQSEDVIPDAQAARVPGQPPWGNDHGAFVTGLVLRQAPGAEIHFRRGLKADGSQDSWDIAKAVAAMASKQLDVLNLSFGCFTDDGQPPLVFAAAIAALGPETVVVAAAGNHGTIREEDTPEGGPRPYWPAAMEGVVAVGALATDGKSRAPFSPDAPWVDVMAPGVDVASTLVGKDRNGFATWSGTSFAAGTVSGELARQMSESSLDAPEAWEHIRTRGRAGELPAVRPRNVEGWPADG